jgi:ElaB/YqjD/DUF883 family membrane-anchored ribosome-binding protein
MTSAQLQREAEAQRAGLSNTLGHLREGMSAQALSAEVVGVARDVSLSLVKSLADSARANPGAALLIGAGLTMLLTRTTGSEVLSGATSALKAATAAGGDVAVSAAGTVRRAAGSVAGTASSMAGQAADTVGDTTHKLADSISETAGAVKDKALGAVDQLRSETSERVELGRGDAKHMLEQGKERAQELEGQAAKMAHDTSHMLTRLLEDQPILVAAIGTALGAILGASFPVSQTERSVLGSVGADAVGAGADMLAKAKNVVGEELAQAGLGDKVGHMADQLVDAVIPTSRKA